jgi:hypothetical protein
LDKAAHAWSNAPILTKSTTTSKPNIKTINPLQRHVEAAAIGRHDLQLVQPFAV